MDRAARLISKDDGQGFSTLRVIFCPGSPQGMGVRQLTQTLFESEGAWDPPHQ